ncbi:hypothetical protein ACFXA3_39200 [Streptomyces sp. NPDC059456]|uniref:hypothetical protein n=1 Tax=Streptomyces sp. NPDC059456 TaxID=3346838 RepID=UPI00369C48A0
MNALERVEQPLPPQFDALAGRDQGRGNLRIPKENVIGSPAARTCTGGGPSAPAAARKLLRTRSSPN